MATLGEFPAPRRIAVLHALYLGDLLCAIPALSALDRRFPDAEITLIALPWARAMVERLPAVDTFLEFPGYPGLPEVTYDEQRTAAFIAEMRLTHYDIAIQLHGSGSFVNELVAEFGADLTVGYCRPGDTELELALPWREDESEIERWLRLVATLGADPGDTRIELPIFERERARATQILGLHGRGFGPVVGFHCGSKLESRRWPIARFAELGDELSRRYDARIVLTGTKGEEHLAHEIRTQMQATLLDLVGKTDLGTFFAVVSQLELLVTNDTGASHVAAATRTPSVVLFGPSRPSRWAPLDETLHAAVDSRAFAGGNAEDDRCLLILPVDRVLDACERILSPASNRRAGPGAIHRGGRLNA